MAKTDESTTSKFDIQPPSTVYQTILHDDCMQDGSTPLYMRIRLAPSTASTLRALQRTGTPLASLVYAALRRYVFVRRARTYFERLQCVFTRLDLRELEQYDVSRGCMLGLRLSQTMFHFTLLNDMLDVYMHRKELPVSLNFGSAPFVLTILLKPVSEMVISSAFHVASKEPSRSRGARLPPKRSRLPSNKIPFTAVASGEELLVTQLCKSMKKRARACIQEDDMTPQPSLEAEADDVIFDFDDGVFDDLLASCEQSFLSSPLPLLA